MFRAVLTSGRVVSRSNFPYLRAIPQCRPQFRLSSSITPSKKTSRFGRVKDQIFLVGFSFIVTLLAGQNYNLRHQLKDNNGEEDNQGNNPGDSTLSPSELEILSLEVGRLVKVWIAEEITEGYFTRSSTISSSGTAVCSFHACVSEHQDRAKCCSLLVPAACSQPRTSK